MSKENRSHQQPGVPPGAEKIVQAELILPSGVRRLRLGFLTPLGSFAKLVYSHLGGNHAQENWARKQIEDDFRDIASN